MTTPHVVVHTDGACSGNPGPGGWGAILAFGDRNKEIKGGEPHTTNNRMELMAAISALEALKRPCVVDIHTDSQYLRDGIMSWINKWKRNGWRTADKKPVKNVDLWQRLDALVAQHRVRWHWVKGHAGHDLNERADELAREGIAAIRSASAARFVTNATITSNVPVKRAAPAIAKPFGAPRIATRDSGLIPSLIGSGVTACARRSRTDSARRP